MEQNKLILLIQQEVESRKQKGLSQAQIAALCKVSTATMSQIVNNNTELIRIDKLRSIAKLLNIQLNGWDILATPVVDTIKNVCDEAKENSRMIGIISATGQGKTTALRLYEQKTSNTYYVLCNVLMSRISFLKSIAQSMSISAEGTSIELLERITSTLNSIESPLLILDDFGKVKDNVYQLLQLIYDECEGSLGIVIAGVPYLREYIKKKNDGNKFCFPELSRRIAYWQVVKPINKNVIAGIAKYHGITDKSAVEFLQKITNNMGQLKEIILSAKKIDENITIETIQTASNHD